LREKGRLRPFVNRVLRRIFGPMIEEITGEWRILHNEKLTEICSSPDVIWVVKSRILTWVGHVVRMEERKAACGVLWENLSE
jgi:hypothetical protein